MIISEVKVLKSNAGYYIGTEYKDKKETCNVWFPYSRVSAEYYSTEKEAEKALLQNNYIERLGIETR